MNDMCLGSFECRCALMWLWTGTFRDWNDREVNLDDFSGLTQRKCEVVKGRAHRRSVFYDIAQLNT